MAESRDPAIKLFGKTIQIPVGVVVSVTIGEDFNGDDGKVIGGFFDHFPFIACISGS